MTYDELRVGSLYRVTRTVSLWIGNTYAGWIDNKKDFLLVCIDHNIKTGILRLQILSGELCGWFSLPNQWVHSYLEEVVPDENL